VGLALRLALLDRAALRLALERETLVLADRLPRRALHLGQMVLEPALERLDHVLAVAHALEEEAILLRHEHQVVPARQELPEGFGREQELQLARRTELVERPQPLAQALALLREQRQVALQVAAREVELRVETLAAALQVAEAAAAHAQLPLGALE